jgi:hypothetical protein
MSSAGGRLWWQTTVSVRTSIVPPGPCPPPADTPHALPVVTTSQVKDSLHDFAVPLTPTGPHLKQPLTVAVIARVAAALSGNLGCQDSRPIPR